MRYTFLICFAAFLALFPVGCFGMQWTGGELILEEIDSSKRIIINPLVGFYVMRSSDFIATQDGFYLQNIFIERIHVDEDKKAACLDWLSCKINSSFFHWPFMLANMQKRFTLRMAPADAAAIVLENRKQNPATSNFNLVSLELQTIGGHECFKAMFEYRITIDERQVPYRTVYYGLVIDDWFYGISYNAAQRYYYDKDIRNFNEVVTSLRFVEKQKSTNKINFHGNP